MAQIADKVFTEMTGRVYDSAGLSPTIQTMQGGNRQPKIQVVGGIGEKRNNGTQYFMQDRIYEGDISNAICTSANPYYKLKNKNFRIRKLTPTECLRLMGVRDEYSKRMTCSNAQKYKQAGNGIVIDVLMAIFKKML